MSEGILVPTISAAWWALASGISILVVVLVPAVYLYFQKRSRAMLKDADDYASLAAERQALQADNEQLRKWLAQNKDELLSLQAERRQQEELRQELAQLGERLADHEQRLQQANQELGEIETQKHNAAQQHERLLQEKQIFEQRIEEAKTELAGLEETLRQGKERNEAELESLLKELEEARKKVLEATDKAENKSREAQQHVERVTELEIRIDRLDAEARDAQSRAGAEKEKFQTQQKLYAAKIDKLAVDLQNAKNAADAAAREAEQKRRDVQHHAERAAELEMRVSRLNAQEQSLQQLIEQKRNELQGLGTGAGPEHDPHVELLRSPQCLENGGEPLQDISETGLLDSFHNALHNKGYRFSRRVIDAFHTSLKCAQVNPLTVLAGVSGTGKTLLPIEYASYLGLHSLVIAVQPRWDSPQDMFGFYNYLEHRYKATELSRALLRMDPHGSRFNGDGAKDRMLLVLLDEMNLARTEYYFSEFLSKLELRRIVERDNRDREKACIELDAGPLRTEEDRFSFYVGPNVLFVGTMNEDETTQTLSDKVLDRANVLRFGRPPEEGRKNKQDQPPQAVQEHYLPYDVWKSWVRDGEGESDWSQEVHTWISELNNALEPLGRPFGYRVQDAIKTYVANYPQKGHGAYKHAFADQVEQKVIPKLRGIDMHDDKAMQALDGLEGVIARLDDGLLEDAFKAAKEDQSTGMFIWRGVTRSTEHDA